MGKLYGKNPASAPVMRKQVVATRNWPWLAEMIPKYHAPISPSPAQRPFMLSMKLKALTTVTIHKMVMA